jgi:hypothetical protein
MTSDAAITLGLIILGVVLVIEDARMHYSRSREKLQAAGEGAPPAAPAPVIDARLDGNGFSGVDADLGAPADFFSTTIGW